MKIDARLIAEAYEQIQKPRTPNARIIVSFDCPRACPTCCNRSEFQQNQMRPANNFEEFAGYNNVSLTGGEPMLHPEKTLKIAQGLKQVGVKNVYLYTAMYDPMLAQLIPLLSGIQYSIHTPCKEFDPKGFASFQELIKNGRGTYRTFIESGVDKIIPILPKAWTRIVIAPMVGEDECALPSSETLYYWSDEGQGQVNPLARYKEYIKGLKAKEAQGQAPVGESVEHPQCFCMHFQQPF